MQERRLVMLTHSTNIRFSCGDAIEVARKRRISNKSLEIWRRRQEVGLETQKPERSVSLSLFGLGTGPYVEENVPPISTPPLYLALRLLSKATSTEGDENTLLLGASSQA